MRGASPAARATTIRAMELLPTDPGDVTLWLAQAEAGAPGTSNHLFTLLYDDLRRRAAGQLRREDAAHTLRATAPPRHRATAPPRHRADA